MFGKYEKAYVNFFKGQKNKDKSLSAVFEIINDLLGRRGLRQEFENIDDDIQEEIIDVWVKLIKKEFYDE